MHTYKHVHAQSHIYICIYTYIIHMQLYTTFNIALSYSIRKCALSLSLSYSFSLSILFHSSFFVSYALLFVCCFVCLFVFFIVTKTSRRWLRCRYRFPSLLPFLFLTASPPFLYPIFSIVKVCNLIAVSIVRSPSTHLSFASLSLSLALFLLARTCKGIYTVHT